MKKKCKCPFCETELVQGCLEPLFCQTCNIEIIKCEKCGKIYNSKIKECPFCKK